MEKAVVFIIDSLCGGGAQRVVVTLANEITDTGIKVFIIATEDENDFEIKKEIDYLVLNDKKNNEKNKIKFLYRKNLSDKLKNIINKIKEKYKVTIFTNLERSHYITHLADIEAYYVIHSLLSQNIKMRKKNPYGQLMSKRKFNAIYEGKKLICVSQGVKKDIEDNFLFKPSLLKVIYNPFNFEEIRKKANEKTYFQAEEKYVLSIATFKPQKRLDLTIESFAKANVNSKLIFLGINEENEKNRLLEIAKNFDISDKIGFANWTENPYPIIKNAKLTLLTSDSEAFGNIIVESLICCTPVVSTNPQYGGPSEILTGKLSKYLANCGDTDKIAELVKNTFNQNDFEINEDINRFKSDNIVTQYLELAGFYKDDEIEE